ncbi:MAG: lyase family protein, partial [Pseudomonadota bacterium]|nr:lyase family protein [Pseudomonadota bacterium]
MVFERFLSTAEIIEVFGAASVVQAMLDFEAALARAEAAEGVIPAAAAAKITACCRVDRFDLEAIVSDGAMAGSLAIPLVKALTAAVASTDAEAAVFVHRGSTSQDAIDTAMVLVTRQALALIERDAEMLTDALLDVADRHRDTPLLGRTLLQ